MIEAQKVAMEIQHVDDVRNEIMAHNKDFVEGELVFVDVAHAKFPNKDNKRKRIRINGREDGSYKVLENEDVSYLVELSLVSSICATFLKDEMVSMMILI